MGSKSRIVKHILPIMLNAANERQIKIWVEPFVGGGNVIDKVPSEFQRIGFDANPHTIAALIAIRDLVDSLPEDVTEMEYNAMKGNLADPITSMIRFGCSFGGKFENGFARGMSNNGVARNYWQETKRNALKQSPHLQGVSLAVSDFACLYGDNALIYCDPPYANTTGYKTGTFDHVKFWNWCKEMAKTNLVFVSEYTAPDDDNIVQVWQGEIKTNFASNRTAATHTAVEKLFLVKG